MKILDERGRLFGKVNLVDMLFVLCAIAVVCVAVIYLSPSGSSEGTDVYFTVELQNVDPEMAAYAQIGDAIYDSTEGDYLGVVTMVSTEPATKIIFDENSGEYVKAEIPGAMTLLVTVRGSAVETNTEVTSEGYPVKMGKEMTLKGKGYAGIGYIVSLYIMEGEA